MLLYIAFISAFSITSVLAMPLKKRDNDHNTSRCPNFCAGTNTTSDPLYICGDSRLGPVTLPTGIPLDGIAGLDSIYHRFGALCPGEFLAKYTDPTTGQFVYPPFSGFQIDTTGKAFTAKVTLPLGMVLDRFGSENGTYMSPGGASYAQRALPPTNLDALPGAAYPYNYHVYTVSRVMVVESGVIAPWFGQPGFGVQFLMPFNITSLVEQGFLSRLNLTADPDW
ncbi:hypothetical protein BT63DRAFT_274574 [Microthyrium microscopicum]|uniref:TNT domain-containing protein n=1 Tax=Microthyrium microscopicum TaxID=703497 RepID=A0A6A6U894_9PEZI|nr:hypothetical protein BT63DRAFT_274574 [Microthyrium microscopicum]